MNNVTLFIVDESVDLEIIKIKVSEYKNLKIISFDFNTHKLLSENGIAHDKIEDYLDNSDYQKIDDAVVSLSVNWYKKKNLEPFLEYRDVNLGSLLEIEMPSFLFPIVKKFYGVLRLFEKDKPSMIVAPLAVSNIMKIISNEVQVHTFEKMKKDNQPSLVFDYIQLKFNIGGIPFRFNIRRHTFFRIKKLLENFTRFFLNLKPDFKRSMSDAILMLDFNPIVYKDLFVELSKLNKQILLLNQRRPAIQNLQSINIIKKAKCKILRLDDFLDSDLKRKIDDNTRAKLGQLYEMWNNDNLLNPIFSVEGYSLWNVVRDSFIQTCKNRFTECIYGLELAAKMLEKIKFKCILEWAHTATDEKIICLEANKLHIPIIFLQHGLMTLNESFEKFRIFFPFFPSNGAKMAVWGDIMKEFNINNGIREDLVLNTGSPRHDVYFSRKKTKGKPKGVIL